MITAANLHRSYSIGKKSIEILHGVDLHIAAGEKVFLCGPSGAGKTTLMYTLAGLETPQEDRKNGVEVLDLLFGLADESRKTLVIVTHDEHLARRGDRIITIMDGQAV